MAFASTEICIRYEKKLVTELVQRHFLYRHISFWIVNMATYIMVIDN